MRSTRGVLIATLPAMLLLAAVTLHLSCGEDPAAPTRDNPLDPGNPETSGDPFGLVAEVRADGVHLSWSIPEGPEIALIRVLRRDDLGGAYTRRTDLGPAATTWKDGTIANGRTYEYKVIAVDRDSRTSSESSVREVRVDMDPVWTLNNGQRYTTTRTVPMTLLATTAVSMRVFAGTDTSGVEWVPATSTPSVTLGGDQGAYQFSGQVRYDDGSESPVWTGTVALDTEPPVIALAQTSLDANTRTVTMSAEGTVDHSGICPADSLTYKWDWGDGESDGPSAHLVNHSHQYTAPGPWTITLTVTDLAGHEADTTWVLDLPNQPPTAPALFSPGANAVGVSRTASLIWQASVDPEGDAIRYNVYHGPAGSMTRVASEVSATTLNLAQPMGSYTQHHWKVVAVDAWGDSAESAVRNFTTGPNQLPTTPSGPNPADGDTGVGLQPTLSWTASTDPEGTAVTYDVYFGESSLPDEPVSADQSNTEFNVPGQLGYETIYYWKVVAKDEDYGEEPSPVWSFTTTAYEPPLEMIQVPSGSFTMGDGTAYCGTNQRTVTLTRDFWLGKYEVTNAEYAEMLQWAYDQTTPLVTVEGNLVKDDMGSNETLLGMGDSGCEISFSNGVFSVNSGKQNHPVVQVTWYGAASFCDWLSLKEGLPAAYNHTTWSCNNGDPYGAQGYRLPTDAEWEYAARYNDGRFYPWGDSEPACSLANYSGCGGIAEVGSRQSGASSLEFLDLAGNVWEWCNDWHQCNLGTSPVTDPVGPGSESYRVLRGGAWNDPTYALRCAFRYTYDPFSRFNSFGFRCARTVDR